MKKYVLWMVIVFVLSSCRSILGIKDQVEVCGDGVIVGSETCDGTNFGNTSCELLGYYQGTLKCSSDCHSFDYSECGGKCGDGIIQANFNETCDGTNFGNTSCESLGYYGGELSCSNDCQTFDTIECAEIGKCGDRILQDEFDEVCDGEYSGALICIDFGYYSGNLLCGNDCQLDYSECEVFGKCGDGIIQGVFNEVCDGTNLNNNTCATISSHYYGGVLYCNSDCQSFDTSECEYCGDGIVQSEPEECDGTNLNGKTCQSIGCSSGFVLCKTDCSYDYTDCSNCNF